MPIASSADPVRAAAATIRRLPLGSRPSHPLVSRRDASPGCPTGATRIERRASWPHGHAPVGERRPATDVTWNGQTVHTGIWKEPGRRAGDGAQAQPRRRRPGRPRRARRRAARRDGLPGRVLRALAAAPRPRRPELGISARTSPSTGCPTTRCASATATASARPSSRSPSRASPATASGCGWASRGCRRCSSPTAGPASTSGSSPRARAGRRRDRPDRRGAAARRPSPTSTPCCTCPAGRRRDARRCDRAARSAPAGRARSATCSTRGHAAGRTGQPAWAGFRPLRVAARRPREPTLVTSVYLRRERRRSRCRRRCRASTSPSGSPAPATRAPVRSYSLSAATRPTATASASSASRTASPAPTSPPRSPWATSSTSRRRAASSCWTTATDPSSCSSAGIGVTPVLAMLQALAAQRSHARGVVAAHHAATPATHVLADEARRLLAALPAAHDHVFYTAPTATARLGAWTGAALAALGLPVDAQRLPVRTGRLHGRDDAPRSTDLGLHAGRIHTELFTLVDGDQPGRRRPRHRPAPARARQPPGTGPMVTFARAGLTVAFDESAASLLELAEACDVPTRWSCRTGVCHTCSTPLLVRRGRPTRPHRSPTRTTARCCCAAPGRAATSSSTSDARRPPRQTPGCGPDGPAEPARYSSSGTASSAHAASTGSTIRHSSSASSPRMDRVGSPSRISFSSRL